METATGVGLEALNQAAVQVFAVKGRRSLQVNFGNRTFLSQRKERRGAAQAHTSAPSSSTPVSITVTYLSSIWTRSTVLSMWDLVPGSLLQGTHR